MSNPWGNVNNNYKLGGGGGRQRFKSDDLDIDQLQEEFRAQYDWDGLLEMERLSSKSGRNYIFDYSHNPWSPTPIPAVSESQSVAAVEGGIPDRDPRNVDLHTKFEDDRKEIESQPSSATTSMAEEQVESADRIKAMTPVTILNPDGSIVEAEFEVVTSRKTKQRLRQEKKLYPHIHPLTFSKKQLSGHFVSIGYNIHSITEQSSISSSEPPSPAPTKISDSSIPLPIPLISKTQPDSYFTDNWLPEPVKTMAPNRRKNDQHQGHAHGGEEQQQQRPVAGTRPMVCCVPTECLKAGKLIYMEDIGTSDLEVEKICCSNGQCEQSGFMHKDCFEAWETSILNYIKNCSRARSWSERQRHQNLWNKRGYDLTFKLCHCKCGKGYLRKDVNWITPERPPAPIGVPAQCRPENPEQQQEGQDNDVAAVQEQMQGLNIQGTNGEVKKKKKSKSKEVRPTLAISAPVPHPNNNHGRGNGDGFGSYPKTNGHSLSQPGSSSGSAESCPFPSGMAMMRNRINSVSSNVSNSSSSSGGSGSPPPPVAQFSSSNISASNSNQLKLQPRKNSKSSELYADRNRRDSNGLFSRRMDFSSFNRLPRYKVNSYQIKMEEESHGNDETRNLILNTLTSSRTYRVCCILCNINLAIFDRFPLIDGTFFLSPRQHSVGSLQVPHNDGRLQFLSAVCMGCLEGWSTSLTCIYCTTPWSGSSLVIGSCYSYDIFAATPCCDRRLSCLNCSAYVVDPKTRAEGFFSEFSRCYRCPHCGVVEYHLAKPLRHVFNKLDKRSGSP